MADQDIVVKKSFLKRLSAEADRAMEVRSELLGLIEELREYFDQRADADYQGEEDGFVGNDEMKMLTEIDSVLERHRGK